MRKWLLSFLILLLLMQVIPTSTHYEIIGGRGGPPYSPYPFSKTNTAEGLETKPGCTLGTANWWSGVSLCGTSLGILCDGGYEGNNVSIHLSTSSVYFKGSVVTTCNDIIIYHGVLVNYEIY
jgi:hypothetical protein